MMKIRIKVRGFLEALQPVAIVATSKGDKEYRLSECITIKAQKSIMVLSSDNGRLRISNEVSDLTYDNVKYENDSNGTLTVRARDLLSTVESFDEDSFIEISDNTDNEGGTSMKITSLSDANDPDEQTLALITESIKQVSDNKLSGEFKCEINKNIWIEGASRIDFARDENYQSDSRYKYWIMRPDEKSIRFAAGNGPRFAVIDFDGSGIIKSSNVQDIIIPNNQTRAIVSVIKLCTSNNVEFYLPDTQDAGVEPIHIKCGSILLEIREVDHEIKWPDESKFLDRNSSIIFTVNIGSLTKMVAGLMATYSHDMQKSNRIHVSNINIDSNNKMLIASSEGTQGKAHRKIELKSVKFSEKESNSFSVKCLTNYLSEMVKNGNNEDDFLQLEIEEDNKPIVVRYYADKEIKDSKECSLVNSVSGISERFSIFFLPYIEAY